jgi:hypothetical protein
MINPSEINLSSLPWLPLDAKSAFPKNPAIYFAIDSQGTIQYIGCSVNPKARWAKHHRYKQLETIGSIRIVYLFVDSPELSCCVFNLHNQGAHVAHPTRDSFF